MQKLRKRGGEESPTVTKFIENVKKRHSVLSDIPYQTAHGALKRHELTGTVSLCNSCSVDGKRCVLAVNNSIPDKGSV
jgi:hypothetical protein